MANAKQFYIGKLTQSYSSYKNNPFTLTFPCGFQPNGFAVILSYATKAWTDDVALVSCFYNGSTLEYKVCHYNGSTWSAANMTSTTASSSGIIGVSSAIYNEGFTVKLSGNGRNLASQVLNYLAWQE